MRYFFHQFIELAPVEIDDCRVMPCRCFQTHFRSDQRMTITVASHPTGECQKGPGTAHRRIGRAQLRVERSVESGYRIENGAIEEEQRVAYFVQRTNAPLTHFAGLPKRFQNLVDGDFLKALQCGEPQNMI